MLFSFFLHMTSQGAANAKYIMSFVNIQNNGVWATKSDRNQLEISIVVNISINLQG
jgi:hypothetical protein